MNLRFIGAVICCLFLCDIAGMWVKVLGQNETGLSKHKVVLKCSDDFERCKFDLDKKCVFYDVRLTQNDDWSHPQSAERKACVAFRRSSIDMLPVDFFNSYTAIRSIDLSSTGLQYIEDFTFSIVRLNELNLSGNELTRLSQKAFSGAKNLEKLDLSRNMISSIDPSAFVDLQALTNLNLSHNKLSNESFSPDDTIVSIDWTMKELKVLDLSYNRIMYYDALPFQSFASMKNLEELYLQHNHISIEYGAFSSNRHLRIVDFSYNSNPYFDFNFLLSLRQLEHVYLNGNGMWHSLDLSDIRSSFPSLKSIGISNNSFSCNILASMIRKLDKAAIEMEVNDEEFVANARNIRGVKCN